MLRLSAGLNTLNGVTIQILQTCFNYNISSSAIVYSKKLKLTFFAPLVMQCKHDVAKNLYPPADAAMYGGDTPPKR